MACRKLAQLAEVADLDTSSQFRDWNGGRYADQLAKYGYYGISRGVVCTGAIIISDDDEVENREVNWADLPQVWREATEAKVHAITDMADTAEAKIRTDLLAD